MPAPVNRLSVSIASNVDFGRVQHLAGLMGISLSALAGLMVQSWLQDNYHQYRDNYSNKL